MTQTRQQIPRLTRIFRIVTTLMSTFSSRDMHKYECGEHFEGLCDNMTSINGETLLTFLRHVSFTGKSFYLDRCLIDVLEHISKFINLG